MCPQSGAVCTHGLHLPRQAWLRGKQNPRSTPEAQHGRGASREPPEPQLHAAPGVHIRWDAAPRQPDMAGGRQGRCCGGLVLGHRRAVRQVGRMIRGAGSRVEGPLPQGLPLHGQRAPQRLPCRYARGGGRPRTPRGLWSGHTGRRTNHHTKAEGSLRRPWLLKHKQGAPGFDQSKGNAGGWARGSLTKPGEEGLSWSSPAPLHGGRPQAQGPGPEQGPTQGPGQLRQLPLLSDGTEKSTHMPSAKVQTNCSGVSTLDARAGPSSPALRPFQL